jgi:host factor-I protein
MTERHVQSQERVQEPFLNELRKSRRPVRVYLRSGLKLEGVLASFDPHMIQLEGAEQQVVFKHEIMSISRAPARRARAASPRFQRLLQPAEPAAVKHTPTRPLLRMKRTPRPEDEQ